MNSNEDNELTGMFIQDAYMRKVAGAYPQLLCVDATYKLLDTRLPVYLFLVEDGNGRSTVVGVGILVNEDEESLNWLIGSLVSKCSDLPQHVDVIVTDKDLSVSLNMSLPKNFFF